MARKIIQENYAEMKNSIIMAAINTIVSKGFSDFKLSNIAKDIDN